MRPTRLITLLLLLMPLWAVAQQVDVEQPENILFEFKSVKEVPPTKFAEQFLKDLNNSAVQSLEQLRWRFDGRKNPADFRQKMMQALEEVELTDDLAIKFTGNPRATASILLNSINDNFDNIFKVIQPK